MLSQSVTQWQLASADSAISLFVLGQGGVARTQGCIVHRFMPDAIRSGSHCQSQLQSWLRDGLSRASPIAGRLHAGHSGPCAGRSSGRRTLRCNISVCQLNAGTTGSQTPGHALPQTMVDGQEHLLHTPNAHCYAIQNVLTTWLVQRHCSSSLSSPPPPSPPYSSYLWLK